MNRDDLTLEELHRPWLAAGVVALMTTTPVKSIRTWTDRGLIPDVLPAEGKVIGRRYSLADAILVAALKTGTLHCGQTVAHALFIAEKAVETAEAQLADDCLGLSEGFDFFAFHGEFPQHQSWTREELADPRAVTPLGRGRPTLFSQGVVLLDLGRLADDCVRAWEEVTEPFNDKALRGRLKPFPKELA